MNPALEIIIPIVVFLGGGVVFFFGFNKMRRVKLIHDTPSSKVRSIAMGLVEVHGFAEPQQILITPFSKNECVYYKYVIKEYQRRTSTDSKGRSHTSYSWNTVGGGEKRIPFFASDDTGRVLVNPEGATCYVNCKKAFYQKAGFLGSFSGILSILKSWVNNDITEMDTTEWNLEPIEAKDGIEFSWGSSVGDRKYYEYYIAPKEVLFVLGTAVNDDNAPGNILIREGSNENTFIISDRSEKEVVKKIRNTMIFLFVFGILLIVGSILLFMKLNNYLLMERL